MNMYWLLIATSFGFPAGTNSFVIPNNGGTVQNKGEMGSHVEGDMRFPVPTGLTGRGVVRRGSAVPWPNGLVPYEFLPGYTIEQQNIIVSAMRKLEMSVAMNGSACIRFRPRQSTDQYYIVIYNGDGCSSYVGMNAGLIMNRTVTLQSSGCLSDGTIMHELLHSLGFYHEQSRPDRDSYVVINYANIQSGMEYNFQKYDSTTAETYNYPYDYSSVMHYSAYAFSANNQPTIVPLQPNVTIGQRNNLSSNDIRVVRTLYNCTNNGITLPPIVVTTTPNIYAVNTTVIAALTTRSSRFVRYRETAGTYYYQAYTVLVSSSGLYRFTSFSNLDTYGYFYANWFFPESPWMNIYGFDDDTAGYNQFQITMFLNSSASYTLVVTTYSPETTGNITILVSGLTRATLTATNGSSTTLTSTSPSTTAPITPTSGATTNYSSALTTNSTQFAKNGGTDMFFYEAIRINVSQTGNYSIRSYSSIDDYGNLYVNSFNPLSPTTNLLLFDDDSAGSNNFQLNATLQAGTNYILVFTTFRFNVTGSFVVRVIGPTRVTLTRISIIPVTNATTRPSTTTSTTSRTTTTTTTGRTTTTTTTGRTTTTTTTGRTTTTTTTGRTTTTTTMGRTTTTTTTGRTTTTTGRTTTTSTTSRITTTITGSRSTTTTTGSINTPGITTTIPSPGVISNYSSILTATSATFTRPYSYGMFFYEAIAFNVSQSGNYTVRGYSSMDDFAYLYINGFDSLNTSQNLLDFNDDSAGSNNFQMTRTLQTGMTYILVYTTYAANATGAFLITATGPQRVNFSRVNRLPATNTTTGCNSISNSPICPVAVSTIGRIVTVDRGSWAINSVNFSANNTYFNLNDSISISGYLQTVTVQYAQGRPPTASARIWIYSIVPIIGGFLSCNRYAIPSSQISTSQLVQMYTMENNSLPVMNGTYIGVGIQDTTACLVATSNNTALNIDSANLTLNTTLYARPDRSRSSIKLSYTIMT